MFVLKNKQIRTNYMFIDKLYFTKKNVSRRLHSIKVWRFYKSLAAEVLVNSSRRALKPTRCLELPVETRLLYGYLHTISLLLYLENDVRSTYGLISYIMNIAKAKVNVVDSKSQHKIVYEELAEAIYLPVENRHFRTLWP